jgi:hypothetical protein
MKVRVILSKEENALIQAYDLARLTSQEAFKSAQAASEASNQAWHALSPALQEYFDLKPNTEIVVE